MDNLQYIVQIEDQAVRLDKLISQKFPELTRNQVQKMLEEELIYVNKTNEKASYKVKEHDIILIKVKEPESLNIEPENIPLDIYYEDQDLIVVNKPAGMVVHPANGHYSNTLVNALLYHCQDLSRINGELRPGIVHRIDKDTSGLLVMAKNDVAHISLAEQFKEKTTVREYLAICHGNIKVDEGTINAPLNRDPNERKQMAVVAGGRKAITHFKVLERFGNFTYIKCILETGRTHQIRVHLNYLGFPLAGDEKYGPKKVIGNTGQYLHATKLGFIHPKTGNYLAFTAPLPDYFEKLLNKLRQTQR